ncbi:MAG: hypothetical protein Q4G71_10340 [Pseudomonadota bacterium]|nr:hypothetical protein [Pseudomonadota bacterium]
MSRRFSFVPRMLCAALLGFTACMASAQAPAENPYLRNAARAEPVRHVDIYVQPYYSAATRPQDAPQVAVGRSFDALLASSRRADIERVADMVRAEPGLVTPMTLMVLAIRSYDVGLRDEAVFWYYASRDRMLSATQVMDFSQPALMNVRQAMHSFFTLAGPVINGYAFCDFERQIAQRQRAVQWVAQNPYQAALLPQVPALPGDRQANLDAGLRLVREDAIKEAAALRDPQRRAEIRTARAQNQADARYCW